MSVAFPVPIFPASRCPVPGLMFSSLHPRPAGSHSALPVSCAPIHIFGGLRPAARLSRTRSPAPSPALTGAAPGTAAGCPGGGGSLGGADPAADALPGPATPVTVNTRRRLLPPPRVPSCARAGAVRGRRGRTGGSGDGPVPAGPGRGEPQGRAVRPMATAPPGGGGAAGAAAALPRLAAQGPL